jgi:hypothetical protein
VNEATTSAVDEALIYIVEFSSRNEELQTPWRTRAKHKKEHGHGDDKDCTLMPWHMSVKHGVILYTRRRNAVSWRSSRVNLSRACGCAITIFGIACALEFKPRHWNKWSKNLVAFVRQKRIKIKLISWRLCLNVGDETLEYARNWNTTWRRRIIAIAHGNPPLLLPVAMGHADSQGGMMPHS